MEEKWDECRKKVQYYPYKYPGKYKVKKSEDSEDEEEVDLSEFEMLAEFKIIKNKRSGKFVVFKVPEKGLWKIVKVFDTQKEAEDFVSGKKEEKAAEEKDEHGCIVGKEEWDDKEKKCMPMTKEEQSAYTDFVGKCMKDGKSMKECAAMYKKEKGSLAMRDEAVCKEGEKWDDDKKVCVPIPGYEKYPAPVKKSETLAATEIPAVVETPKVETPAPAVETKPEETPKTEEKAVVTTPEPAKEPEKPAEVPKVEEKPAEKPVETQKEEPKVEAKPEEKPAETPKEEPKTEEKPVEEPKVVPPEEEWKGKSAELITLLKQTK